MQQLHTTTTPFRTLLELAAKGAATMGLVMMVSTRGALTNNAPSVNSEVQKSKWSVSPLTVALTTL